MIKATVRDLFDHKLDDLKTGEHSLYIVKAGEIVLYVGRSINPIARLWQHFGLGHRAGAIQGSESQLGFLIKLMWPESATWQIELLTPGDAGLEERVTKGISREEWEKKPDLFRFFTTYETATEDRFYYSQYDVERAERRLIEQLHPCLNGTYNENPTPLPSRIERKLFKRYCLDIPTPTMPWDEKRRKDHDRRKSIDH